MPAYADPADVRGIQDFPTLTDPQIEGFIAERSGEYDTMLAIMGVTIPITAPPSFLEMLKLGVTYGAAASCAARLNKAVDPDRKRSLIELYLGEYERILDWLKALTNDQLVKLGLLTTSDAYGGAIGIMPGLILARNRSVDYNGSAVWMNYYPFRRTD